MSKKLQNLTIKFEKKRNATKRTLGGSVVILIPTCRMEIGKCGFGEELSHNLKSGCGSSIYNI